MESSGLVISTLRLITSCTFILISSAHSWSLGPRAGEQDSCLPQAPLQSLLAREARELREPVQMGLTSGAEGPVGLQAQLQDRERASVVATREQHRDQLIREPVGRASVVPTVDRREHCLALGHCGLALCVRREPRLDLVPALEWPANPELGMRLIEHALPLQRVLACLSHGEPLLPGERFDPELEPMLEQHAADERELEEEAALDGRHRYPCRQQPAAQQQPERRDRQHGTERPRVVATGTPQHRKERWWRDRTQRIAGQAEDGDAGSPCARGRCSSTGLIISADSTGGSRCPATTASSSAKQYLKNQETTIAAMARPSNPCVRASISPSVRNPTSMTTVASHGSNR